MNDEYISKQKVIDYLNGYLHSLGEGGADDLLFNRGQRRALINAIQDISAVKAADVQPVKCSRWIPKNDGTYKVYCESCGHEQNPKAWDSDYKYCPNCGAEMKGESICYGLDLLPGDLSQLWPLH